MGDRSAPKTAGARHALLSYATLLCVNTVGTMAIKGSLSCAQSLYVDCKLHALRRPRGLATCLNMHSKDCRNAQ